MPKLSTSLILIAILAIGVAVGAAAGTRVLREPVSESQTRQAVFLTNGQVYFGRVAGESRSTVRLHDIYYLQVQQPLQPPAGNDEAEESEISLVKLGNELHGPKDEMRINRDHVLFIVDMKPDSQVNQAVEEFIRTDGRSPEAAPNEDE